MRHPDALTREEHDRDALDLADDLVARQEWTEAEETIGSIQDDRLRHLALLLAEE